MSWRVAYTEEAMKSLRKMDPSTRAMLLTWIRKRLDGCPDPRAFGKGLTANRSGQWRYRVGDWRILARIEDDRVVILILEIGHRSEVYR